MGDCGVVVVIWDSYVGNCDVDLVVVIWDSFM